MTLVLARQHFVEISGRYDLVVDSIAWANNGADQYIQAGQRWLDRSAIFPKTTAKYYKALALGAWYDLISDCRTIREVWMSNSNGNKWKLNKRPLTDILYYSIQTISQVNDWFIPREIWQDNVLRDPGQLTNGAPINYSPVVIRTSPEVSSTVTIDTFGPATYTAAGRDFYNVDGIVFLPPALDGHVLEVTGDFYQPKLTNDSDKNYWTEQEEFILVLAACRAIEVTMRNQQGVADWENAIATELRGMEFDVVEEESAEVREIRG